MAVEQRRALNRSTEIHLAAKKKGELNAWARYGKKKRNVSQ